MAARVLEGQVARNVCCSSLVGKAVRADWQGSRVKVSMLLEASLTDNPSFLASPTSAVFLSLSPVI